MEELGFAVLTAKEKITSSKYFDMAQESHAEISSGVQLLIRQIFNPKALIWSNISNISLSILLKGIDLEQQKLH